jgi:hypothetical protein
MGVGYDFELTVNLREDAPDEIIRCITYVIVGGAGPPEVGADSEVACSGWFDQPFWKWVNSTAPHAGDAVCSFRNVHRYTQQGIQHFAYTLHLRFAARAEVLFELALPFAQWLAQWSSQSECVGYFKGEGTFHPSLLYIHKSELYILPEIEDVPRRVTDGAKLEHRG